MIKKDLKTLLAEIKELEAAVTEQLNQKNAEFKFKIEEGKIRFEKEMRDIHQRAREGLFRFVGQSSILVILTAPVIYSMIIPGILLDLMVTIYQRICFPVYGIPLVNRREYITFDRWKLSYLNVIERFNCIYCSYFNGVIAYVREVAARSEQYWCPIRHALRNKGLHSGHSHFLPYGDSERYHERLDALRKKLNESETDER